MTGWIYSDYGQGPGPLTPFLLTEVLFRIVDYVRELRRNQSLLDTNIEGDSRDKRVYVNLIFGFRSNLFKSEFLDRMGEVPYQSMTVGICVMRKVSSRFCR